MQKELDDFMQISGKVSEIKRALAVKQDLLGKPRPEIAEFLGVHPSFVSKWRLIYDEYGVEGLFSQHKGGSPRAFLKEEDLKLIYAHIRSHKVFGPEQLMPYLKEKYSVSFKSMQSYYEILHAAEMSWHKSQKSNPRKDEEKVLEKRKELKKKFKSRQKAIKKGEIVVLFEDECHVRHGDAEGNVWAKKGDRVSVPMMNERHSQTFYGALNMVSKEFHLKEYDWANMENTVDFLKYLREQYKKVKQLIIVWDGASFHKGKLVQEYLQSVNKGLKESKWKIHCLLFAPNAPEQNPVEDCWLKAKNYVRKHILENKTFRDVVNCFKKGFNELSFDFGKLEWYF